jgi:RHS repeat-associated protein
MKKGISNYLVSVLSIGGCLILLLIGAASALAQTGTRNTEHSADKTLKSNARVNPSTLAMEFSIPLGVYPGRAGNSMPINLNYSSKVWNFRSLGVVLQDGNVTTTEIMGEFAKKTAAGWTSDLGVPSIEMENDLYRGSLDTNFEGQIWRLPIASEVEEEPGLPLYYVKRLHVKMPDGSSHEFRVDDALIRCGSTPVQCTPDYTGTYLSVDGSRLRLEMGSSASTLFMPDGSRYLFGAGSGGSTYANTFIDRSGNKLSFNFTNKQWTDTMGRTINVPLPFNLNGQEQTVNNPTVISLPALGSTPRNATLSWKQLDDVLISSQSLGNVGDYYCNGGSMTHITSGTFLFTQGFDVDTKVCTNTMSAFNPVVLDKITLPDGQVYQFKYNIYGEIVKIIYPTGGYERFQYGVIEPVQPAWNAYDKVNRGVTDRWISLKGDGSDESDMHTHYVAGATSGKYTVTTTLPDNTQTVQYLYYQNNPETPQPYGYGDAKVGMSYEDRVYSSNYPRKLLMRHLTDYTATEGHSGEMGTITVTRDMRPVKEITITFDPNNPSNALAQMSETVYETPGPNGPPTDPAYFAALNAKQTKVYDYVAVDESVAESENLTFSDADHWFFGAAPARTTDVVYLYDPDYMTRNISGLVAETRIKDASGNVKARTVIGYDESAYTLPDQVSLPTVVSNSWIDLRPTLGSKRGLPTTLNSYYDIANNSYIHTHTFYDQFGNVGKVRDGRDNDTETLYDADYAFAYPTSVTGPAPDSGAHGSSTAFTSSVTYNYNTGLPVTATDANGVQTTMDYDANTLRPTLTKAAYGTANEVHTEYQYGTTDSNGQLAANQRFTYVKTQIDASNWKEGYTWFDQLGRTIKSQSVDSDGDVIVETEYDNMSRPKTVTNPYRMNETVYKTESFYDDLGRVTKVKSPDNAEVLSAYSLATSGDRIGNVVTVTDQAGKLRRSITNGLGQLKRVDEPDVSNASNPLGAINSPNQPTYYSYDLLNNLIQVQQTGTTSAQCGGGVNTSCTQNRYFSYDALSRLKQAINPESGTIQYTYDANGNLLTKTDARPLTITYGYDKLNRVITRDYSDLTPDVAYYYDNLTNAKGRLIKVDNGVSKTEYTQFDAIGRVTRSRQTTDNVAYNEMEYSYNLGGALVEETYPSGRKVKNVLDANGDLSMVKSKKSANYGYWNYADSFTYTAAGAVSSMQLGNFRWESTTFNSRLQPTQIALGTIKLTTESTKPLATSLLKLDFTYDTIGQHDNNGNVLSQTITVPTVGSTPGFKAVQTYTYDSLNRIHDAKENIDESSTPEWKQTFSYDRFGNRTFDEANTTTLLKNCGGALCAADRKLYNPTPNTIDNRLSTADGYTFDNAGNTTINAQRRKFTYDGENKQIKVETLDLNDNVNGLLGEYWYDGDGKRVKKHSFENDQWVTTIFVYDASGKLVEEYSTAVEAPSTAKVSYLTSDHLGSPRITTDQNGAIIARHDYQPFGEEIATSQRYVGLGYDSDNVRKKFTSYERDNESGLDYAQARMFGSSLGRFTSPDAVFVNLERLQSPHSLNLYIYARNNPLRYVDPSGLWEWSAALGGGSSDASIQEEIDSLNSNECLTNSMVARVNDLQDILTRRANIRAGFNLSQDIINALANLPIAADLQAIKDQYGTENDGNDVVIGIRDAKDTSGVAFTKIENGKRIVAISESEINNSNSLFATLMHEGKHLQQASVYLATGNNLPKWQAEFDAYDNARIIAIGGQVVMKGTPPSSAKYTAGTTQIGQGDWTAQYSETKIKDHLVSLQLMQINKQNQYVPTQAGANNAFPGKGVWH